MGTTRKLKKLSLLASIAAVNGFTQLARVTFVDGQLNYRSWLQWGRKLRDISLMVARMAVNVRR
jgi:hypothetical protein